MELDHVPEHLLVLGGGYIGVEFGQMFRRFGSRVTIVQHGPQLLGREDEDITSEVLRIFEEDGITVLLDSTALSVHLREGGELELEVQTPQEVRSLVGSHLLVAVGRAPNTEALNLESVGLKLDSHGFIQVDERLQTNQPGIYAMGDVNGGPAFTHMAYDDFRILRANLLEGGQASTQGRMVPYTVFMDPQLGRVGLTEDQARRKGMKIRVAKMPMNYVSRALEVDESRGLMKAVVDAASGQILGFAALGMEGGELMAMVEIAMLGRLPYTVLKEAVFAHPTLAESLNTLFMQMDQG
jgi:pyruvate/2-oxoglutarate dehydrogenase complex dihydrolipoamide dehydrogenase (E3) component